MTYPPLPEPIIIEGRRLYTAGQMREYAKQCAGTEDEPYAYEPPTRPDHVETLKSLFGMTK